MLKHVCAAVSSLAPMILILAALTGAQAMEGVVPTLDIRGKAITGTLEPDNYIAYRGIKYAQAPVDGLRWKPPVENVNWAEKGAFDKFGSPCATKDTLGVFGKTSHAEDCLYLNVYMPRKRGSDDAYPVLFWIAGGGLSTGSGNDYNPAFWTDRGIVVVTFNYRVGVFGFFSDLALDDQNAKANLDSVNYGFMDQQEALRWTQRNISAFGADPKNITISGESAGGSSVFSHLISPASAGLFHKAMVSSGSYAMNEFNKYTLRKIFSEPIIHNTPCKEKSGSDRLSCLQGMTTQQVLDASISYLSIARIVTGTEAMPLSISGAFVSGQFHRVPLIIGANHDEGMFFAWAATKFNKAPVMSKDQFYAAMVSSLGPVNAEKISKRIETPGDGNYFDKAARFLGDARFVCRTPLIGQLASKYAPTYLYLFSPANPPMYFDAGFSLMATHTSDLPYIFKDFAGGLGYPAKLDGEHKKLSSVMMDSYAAFLKTGKPGAMNGETWFPTSNEQDYMMLSDGSQKMRRNYSDDKNCLDPDIAFVLDSPFY